MEKAPERRVARSKMGKQPLIYYFFTTFEGKGVRIYAAKCQGAGGKLSRGKCPEIKESRYFQEVLNR